MSPIRVTTCMLALGVVLVAGGCGGGSDSELEIAFVTSRDGVYSIYVMNAEGGGERRLTDEEPEGDRSPSEVFFEIEPAWSPNAEEIAFASRRTGSFDIFLTNADGKETRRVTSTRDHDTHPTWSPDGTQIAFQRGDPGHVFVMDANGGAARRLTANATPETWPAWSPDGRWIAFAQRDPGTTIEELWLVRPDGTQRHKLTDLKVRSSQPAWSPDGGRVAFSSSKRGATGFDIYTIEPDGAGLTQVTESPADEFEPAWSADGTTIVFNRDGAIVAVGADGQQEQTLTDSVNNDGSPAWRPADRAVE